MLTLLRNIMVSLNLALVLIILQLHLRILIIILFRKGFMVLALVDSLMVSFVLFLIFVVLVIILSDGFILRFRFWSRRGWDQS